MGILLAAASPRLLGNKRLTVTLTETVKTILSWNLMDNARSNPPPWCLKSHDKGKKKKKKADQHN